MLLYPLSLLLVLPLLGGCGGNKLVLNVYNWGEYISDGGWQHQKANKVVVDRASLVARARELYKKWNSEKAESVIGGKITIKSIY